MNSRSVHASVFYDLLCTCLVKACHSATEEGITTIKPQADFAKNYTSFDMTQEKLSVSSNGQVCVPQSINSDSNCVAQYLQSVRNTSHRNALVNCTEANDAPPASSPTVISIHHYQKGLLCLSAINLSYLHVPCSDIPTSFSLIMSILQLSKNACFSA